MVFTRKRLAVASTAGCLVLCGLGMPVYSSAELVDASRAGDVAKVKQLLDQGASLDVHGLPVSLPPCSKV